MFHHLFAALALVALAVPAYALDIVVSTDKAVYETGEIVTVTAKVGGQVPQTRVKFSLTGVNNGLVFADPQHYGGRRVRGSGIVIKRRRVQPSRNFGGGVNAVTHPAEKGDFTFTAEVFNPPSQGGQHVTSSAVYNVP